MKTYDALADALEDVARRSFYESCRVYRQGSRWIVEDWHTGVEETQKWSYTGGIHDRGQWLDVSRAMEPSDRFDYTADITYNLPVAVETLLDPDNEGAVGFTYVILNADCDLETDEHEDGICLDCDGYGETIVGWALVATEEGI